MKMIATNRMAALAACIVGLAWGTSAHAQQKDATTPHADAGLRNKTTDGRLSPRLQNLGKHTRKVSTTNAMAQKYFDQGLILGYAFNHAEAARSFKEAQRLDPDLAIAYWGEAYVLGPNINVPMDESANSPAYEAIQTALKRKAKASEVERAMINAMATRYVADPEPDRAALDKAYADAMRALAKRYPDDADIQAITAESIMDTDPWNYWTNDGHARPYTTEVVYRIEKALALNTDHPLARHLHIHALEASQDAHRAVRSAERLGALVPGAGHIVHMPSHIFFRVARYSEAAAANQKAIAVDEDYISQCKAQGIYPAAYYPHNIHFLWIAYSYEGRSADAMDAAKKTASKPHADMAGMLQGFIVAPYHTQIRFAKWDDALAEPRPADNLRYVTAVWHWARGMALTAKGRPDEAESELASLRAVLATSEFPEELVLMNSPPERMGRIAERLLAGEIAWARKDLDEAIDQFSSAARLEDSLTYNEPPDWPYSTRHWLGAALLADGQPVEAEAVYLEDLRRRPNNGWGLFGLVQAVKTQGENRKTDLEQAQARWRNAWRTADVKLTTSKF